MRLSFARMLLWVCGAFIALFAVEFFLEWWRLGRPGVEALSWNGVNNAKLVDVLSPMARAYNNILAMLIATIGLAIPLTANMHTPKLIDMFLRDRLNQAMLLLIAFGAANVLFVAYIIGPKFAPMWAFRFAIGFALLGWALLIPYFFYVVRFLDPSNILARLKSETMRILDDVASGKNHHEKAQHEVHERLFQIGTVVLKSLDRSDRGVALEGVWTLKQLIDYYGRLKPRMPAPWFVIDRADFVGLSPEALELLNEERTWFEMKAMTQVLFAYQAALSKTSDVVSSVSDAVRVIGLAAHKRGDSPMLGLCIRVFNNFMREGIKRKDVHSMYDVLYEYRLLARDLEDVPDRQREIARHVRFYAASARAGGVPFIQHLAAFELGFIVRRAYEEGGEAARDLLDHALAIPHREGDARIPMVVKAKLKLGGFFVQRGLAAEAKVVADDLADVPASELRAAEQELLSAERSFFEVTDRQENLDYLKPERRAPTQRFVADLCARKGPAAA